MAPKRLAATGTFQTRSSFRSRFQPRSLLFEPLEPRALLTAVSANQVLNAFTITGNVGEKPESKIWKHADRWWGVFSDSSGSYVWRLDGLTWTKTLKLSSTSGIYVDAKSDGDVTHVLFRNNLNSQLHSLQYVPGTTPTYQPWSSRPTPATVRLASSVEAATIDLDSTGRMWVAYDDNNSKIEVRYSDAPYSTWSNPIVLAGNVDSDDVAALAALPNGRIGVFWSDQTTGLFGFRTHVDGTDPTAWTPDERPASQSVLSNSGSFADDHLNLAVASDGTLYAGVKTGYHTIGSPEMGILVRRPNGVWDDFYVLDVPDGTRPIIQLNEMARTLIFSYDNDSAWVYHECSTVNFQCSAAQVLVSSGDNGTSTKQSVTDDLVVLTSGKTSSGKVNGARLTFNTQNTAPVVDAGPNRSIYDTQSASLAGTVSDDGRPNPPATVTAAWSKVSGPGTASFADPAAPQTTVSFNTTGVYVLKLTASDSALTSSDTVTVTVSPTPVNQPPLVNAGPDTKTYLSTPLLLDGTVSDDGLPGTPGTVTTKWSQVSGPGTATFGNDTAVDTTVSFSQIGSYTLRLSAFDGELTGSDEMLVTVDPPPPNQAPVVNAGPDQTIYLGSPALLSGSFTDDNQPVPQASVVTGWSLVSGPGTVTFQNAASLQTSATFSQPGSYVLELSANDSELTGSDRVTITVSDAPPPKETLEFRSGVLPSSTYSGARDTKLRSDNPTTNYGTNSKLEIDGSPDFTSLLQWDISAIPSSATVVAASITVNVVERSLATFEVYELLRDWVETQATFQQAATNVSWSTPGASGIDSDRGDTVLGTITAPSLGSVTVDLNAAGIAVVQRWVTNPASNYGIVFQDFADGSTDDLDFSSREDSTTSRRPKLTIEYLPTGSDPGNPPPVNQPPAVNAGADASISLASVLSLDGTVTDDGLPSTPGTITTQWSQVSGPGTASFGNDSAVDTTVTFSAAGTYTLRLSAFDGELTGSDDLIVTVNPPPLNQAPLVQAGADGSISLTSVFSLDGTVSDDGLPSTPGSVTTQWSQVSGPGTATFGSAAAVDTTVTFSQVGIYTLRLSASDGELTSSDELQVTVNTPPPNKAPVVDAGPDQTIFFGSPALLSGSFTDDNQPVPQASVVTGWSQVSGPGTVTLQNAASLQTSATFSQPGSYVLELSADDSELTGSDRVTITVSDAPPPKETIAFQSGVLPSSTYSGARDTKLRSDNPTANYGTNTKLEIDGSPDFTSLLQWDISAIPSFATVVAASITVNVVERSLATFEVYELLRDWVETQATFQQAATSASWNTPGASGIDSDRGDTVLGTITAPSLGSVTVDLNAAGIAVVQRWVTNPASNYGIVFQDFADGSTDDLDFSSREDSTTSRRPKLTIEYLPTGSDPGNPPPVNQPPAVNAGADASISLASVLSLDGTVTDDGLPSTPGTITTQWSQVSGPGTATFGSDASVDTTVTFSEIGTYTLRLSAFDGELTSSDELQVTVLTPPPNQAPVVDAGKDQTIYFGSPALLSGSFTDDHQPVPRESVVTTWKQISGPGAVTFVNAAALQTSANFSQAGSYVLELSANDSALVGTDTVTISVSDAPPPEETIAFQSGVFPTSDYSGASDTKLRADNQTTNYGSNRKLEIDGKPDFTSLLKWDVSGIPSGATVISATITVNVVETSVATFELYEVLRDWVETQATFLQAAANVSWNTPGASGIGSDRGDTVLGTITAPSLGSVTVNLNAEGIAVVQRWVADPGSNYGLVFQDFADESTDDLDFSSREESTLSWRPKLTIQYLPVSSSQISSSSLHNTVMPHDVTGDSQVTALDALVIINTLNRNWSEGEGHSALAVWHPDVSGDGTVTTLDALLVINHLNRSRLPSSEGETSLAALNYVIANWEDSDDPLYDDLVAGSAAGALSGKKSRAK